MSSPSSDLNSHFSDVIVRAGAGAGKTRDLVYKVLALEEEILKKEDRHAHLVVTTFTRKATQELRERLMALALEKNNLDLIEFVQRSSQLHISTIHGILSVYLTRFGADLGLGPHFKILSKNQLRKFNKRIFRQVLKKKTELASAASELLETQELNKLLDTLESYYHLWCQGKARRATVADLESCFREEVREYRPSVDELVSWIRREDAGDKWLIYADQLENFMKRAESAENLVQMREVIGLFVEHTPAPRKTSKISEELAETKNSVQKKIKSWTESRYSDMFFREHENLSSQLEILGQEFCQALLQQKISTGFLSLSDLELLAYKLARDFPRTAELFSKEWDYWLVDEYQDTSPLQVELLQLLMGSAKSYTVGDPQQSIYLFRGARSEVFTEKEKIVRASQGEHLLRMTNYRSRPQMLHFFNDIFTAAHSRQFQPMDVGYNKGLPEHESESVHYVICESVEEEVQSALARVQELASQKVPLEQICILARTNDLLETVAQQARPLQIPVQVHSSTQFSVRREVQDALALLKFLVNPTDNYNFIQLIRSPWLKVPDRYLQHISQHTPESFYHQALRRTEVIWKPVHNLSLYLQQSKQQGLTVVWLQAMVDLGVFDLGMKLDVSGRREANLWKLVSLVKEAERQPGFSVLEFVDQLTEIQVDSEGDGDATPVIEPKRVSLLTVHASKGLQFQYVIVLGMGKRPQLSKTEFFLADTERGVWSLSLIDPELDKQAPTPLGSCFLEEKKQRELFESERVFYVALTRAVLGTTLVWSQVSSNSWAELLPLEVRSQTLDPDEELLGSTANYSFKIRKGPLKAQATEIQTCSNVKKIRTRYVAPGGISHREKVSVTQLLQERITTDDKKIEQLKGSQASLAGLEKAIRGVEIHRLFEGLKYKENLAPENPVFQKAREFVKTWKDGVLMEIITRGEVEWGFAVVDDKTIIQGQVDLWGTSNSGAYYIVDYKTGSQAHLEKAFEQLEIYARALRRIRNISANKAINLLVVYPLEEKVFERVASNKI